MTIHQRWICGIGLLFTMLAFTASVLADDTPTYYHDIAPILQKSCVTCHAPGKAGPFPLLTYSDAHRRVSQLVQVTQSGFMPPWQTTTKGLCGERGLTSDEKTVLKRWMETGTLEGEKPTVPLTSTTTDDSEWPLGKPDVIVTMPKPFTLPASAFELTHCFVLPSVVHEAKRLRAITIRPSNPRIVRSVTVYPDNTGTGRKQEQLSGTVGYFGFTGGIRPSPMGSLADWSPGVADVPLPPGASLILAPETDMILQVRFHTTGKPEIEQMKVGLYFTSEPTTIEPITVRLGGAELYLPKESTAILTDTFTLPTAAEVFEIVPNAHFIAQKIAVDATLPDGTITHLLEIPDWDANWRQPYRLAVPLKLPAGTRLNLKMTFDVTSDNPRSPYKPAHRVIPGLEFMEEMSSVWIRLLPENAADRETLRMALPSAQHHPTIDIDEHEREGQPPPRRPAPPGKPTTVPNKVNTN